MLKQTKKDIAVQEAFFFFFFKLVEEVSKGLSHRLWTGI